MLQEHELKAVIVQLVERINRLEQTVGNSTMGKTDSIDDFVESDEEGWSETPVKKGKRGTAMSTTASKSRKEAWSRGEAQSDDLPVDKERGAV